MQEKSTEDRRSYSTWRLCHKVSERRYLLDNLGEYYQITLIVQYDVIVVYCYSPTRTTINVPWRIEPVMSYSLKISGHDPSEHVFCVRYSENICLRVNASRPLRSQLE